MKLVIFGVIAFVVGLGGSTGVAVMKAPPPKAAATDSSAVDSPSHPAPVAASPVSDTDHEPQASADSSSNLSSGRTPAATDSSATAEVAGYANAVALDTPEQQAHRSQLYKRVARILVAMKPKDAAAILAQLSDDQLEGIFRALGVREAAAMMAQLPAERGAEMSRRIIEEPQAEAP